MTRNAIPDLCRNLLLIGIFPASRLSKKSNVLGSEAKQSPAFVPKIVRWLRRFAPLKHIFPPFWIARDRERPKWGRNHEYPESGCKAIARKVAPFLLPILACHLGLVTNVQAQVFGEAARTEFFGGLGIRTFYSRINKTQLLFNGNDISDSNKPKVFVNLVPVALVYGLRPKWSLIAVAPMVTRTFERTVNSQRISETVFGPGDVTLYVKYRFYKKDAFLASRQFAAQLGVKLPTGADNSKDRFGNRLPQPLQLGSGSVDTRFALIFTEARNRLIFSGDLGYTLKTEANEFEFGDLFNYDFAAKFRLLPAKFIDGGSNHQLFLFLELNGVVGRKAKAAGHEIPDSGGHQLFVAPGLQFFLLENFLWEAGVQVPVLQNLNGTQLGTDFHFRTGVRWIVAP